MISRSALAAGVVRHSQRIEFHSDYEGAVAGGIQLCSRQSVGRAASARWPGPAGRGCKPLGRHRGRGQGFARGSQPRCDRRRLRKWADHRLAALYHAEQALGHLLRVCEFLRFADSSSLTAALCHGVYRSTRASSRGECIRSPLRALRGVQARTLEPSPFTLHAWEMGKGNRAARGLASSSLIARILQCGHAGPCN